MTTGSSPLSGTASRPGAGLRLLALAIDGVFALVIAVLLSSTTGRWFAGRSVVMLSIGSPDTFWRGPIPMMMGILGSLVYGLPFAALLVMLPEAILGVGVGKWAARLRIAAADGSPVGARTLWLRWCIKCAGLWGMTLALVLGWSPVAFLTLAASAVVIAGFLSVFGHKRLALHDRLSGTVVVRK